MHLPHHLLTVSRPEEVVWTDLSGDEQQNCCESHLMITLFPRASRVKTQVLHCIAGLAVSCGVAQVSWQISRMQGRGLPAHPSHTIPPVSQEGRETVAQARCPASHGLATSGDIANTGPEKSGLFSSLLSNSMLDASWPRRDREKWDQLLHWSAHCRLLVSLEIEHREEMRNGRT